MAPTMAAITSITNPAQTKDYVTFFNDPNNQLAALQLSKGDSSTSIFSFNTTADQQTPTGPILNPSSLTSTLLDYTANVYGVVQGQSAQDQLICRLSPGFAKLNISPPISKPYSLAACSDGKRDGYLFYVATTDQTLVYSTKLPGTQSTSQVVPWEILFNKQTYLGAVYGVVGTSASTYYLAAQGYDSRVHVYNGETQTETPISQAKGVTSTPLAILLHGNTLVVYWFGQVGAGQQPNVSPLYRAVSTNFGQGFNFTELDNAPAPSAFTQLSAVSYSSSDGGNGSIILNYVQNTSNELVSWQDPMDGFNSPPEAIQK